MPAKDTTHNVVKNALAKEGWIITDDPLLVQFGDIDLYIDLGAEKIIAAEKNGEKIAVEIKSFIRPSFISDFHLAMGQFINYRAALNNQDPDRILYLAVPLDTYEAFFSLQFVQFMIESQQLKLIVYNIGQEEIVLWKK